VAEHSNAERVQYARTGRIAHIQLNRPEKLNAFDREQVLALTDALREFDTDTDAWIAIISGTGSSFSSGADVGELRDRDTRASGAVDADHAGWLYRAANWKPVITAAHGHVLGLALGLVLQSDLRIATPATRFQVTETSRGLPAARYWSRLRFHAVSAFVDDVVLTGRAFSGAEAHAAGLLTALAPEGTHLELAWELAERVAANPPLSVRASVAARRAALQRFERDVIGDGLPPLHLTEDFRESVAAFAEKRAAGPFHAR